MQTLAEMGALLCLGLTDWVVLTEFTVGVALIHTMLDDYDWFGEGLIELEPVEGELIESSMAGA